MTNDTSTPPRPEPVEGVKGRRSRKGCLAAVGVLFLLMILYVIYPHLPFGRKISPADLDTITVTSSSGSRVVLDKELTARLVKNLKSEWYVVRIWLTHLNATAQLKNGERCDLLMEFHSGTFVIEGQGFRYYLTGDSREAWSNEVLPLLMAPSRKQADNETRVK